MTLILTCLTQDTVVQVSDRRLAYLDGSLADDSANKATVYCGHFAFAYTGLAQLGEPTPADGKPHTDWWLTEVLGGQQTELAEAFADVAEAATVEVKRLGIRDDHRRTAFVGAGWRKDEETSTYRPMLVSISNFTDAVGVVGPTTEDFRVTAADLGESRYWWTSAGQNLTDREKTDTNRLVKKVMKGGKGAAALATVLAGSVRRVARRNTSVGEDLMVAILPVQDVPFSVSVPLGGPPAHGEAQFLFLPAAPGFELFTPNMACNGIALAGGTLWTGTGSPPGWVPAEWRRST